jgi:aminopeptidase 2
MLESDRVVLSPAIIPTHYSLELSPDFVSLEFGCDEEITLSITESKILEITLHSKEINVIDATFKSLSLDTSVVNPSIVCISYNLKLKTVTFVFDAELPVGESILSIKFKGILNGYVTISPVLLAYFCDPKTLRCLI